MNEMKHGPIGSNWELLEMPQSLQKNMLVNGEQMVRTHMIDLPQRAAGLVFAHILNTEGEEQIVQSLSQWDGSLEPHQVERAMSYMKSQAEEQHSWHWKGGKIPDFHHLFPNNITGKGTFTEVEFSPPEIRLYEDPQEPIALMPKGAVRDRMDNKYIFSPGGILTYAFRVHDWKRKASTDAPLDGVMVHPFVLTMVRNQTLLDTGVWGTHDQIWTPDSMSRITIDKKIQAFNAQRAHALRYLNLTSPFSGGGFEQNN